MNQMTDTKLLKISMNLAQDTFLSLVHSMPKFLLVFLYGAEKGVSQRLLTFGQV